MMQVHSHTLSCLAVFTKSVDILAYTMPVTFNQMSYWIKPKGGSNATFNVTHSDNQGREEEAPMSVVLRHDVAR